MTISKTTRALPTDVNRLLAWEQTHGRLADERAMRGARASLRSVQEAGVEAHGDAAEARFAGGLVNVATATKDDATSGQKPIVELGRGGPGVKLAEAARGTLRASEDLGEKWAAQVIGSGQDDRMKLIDDAVKSIERAIAKAHEQPKSRLV